MKRQVTQREVVELIKNSYKLVLDLDQVEFDLNRKTYGELEVILKNFSHPDADEPEDVVLTIQLNPS